MKSIYTLFIACLFLTLKISAQEPIRYEISFENAVHHEAKVFAEFTNLDKDVLSLRMSRTSPGRYAIHEFAKNIYGFSATDGHGNSLKVTRPNPYQWDVSGHDGTVKISYTLFANRGDGTYSQVDETHAHLNIPATFIYAPDYTERPINIKFNPRKDLHWKIATQLKLLEDQNYYAPDLDYFMDSPVELSNHELKSFKLESKGKIYLINFALHQIGNYEGFDAYFEKVKKVVIQEVAVFGELPEFDFDSYTFLACYIPNANGDGMEHRNSTILTSTRSLDKGGLTNNIGIVAHEFFHAWNVERIRPASLEPFDYADTNISGELWFAEGFTSYYTNLTLCRAGIISKEAYVSSLARSLGSVWNSPARIYFNPIEMSYQATFVDAATAIDPVNRENTFISYYTYGNVLGLALDLSLRNLENDKNLDGFMQMLWQSYGKSEIPYTINDLKTVLSHYAKPEFAQQFFDAYIYQSGMPDYKDLFSSVGIEFDHQFKAKVYLGALLINDDNKWLIASNPEINSALYKAGMVKGDRIVSINGRLTNQHLKPNDFLKAYQPGESVEMVFNRFGEQKKTAVILGENKSYRTSLKENIGADVKQRQRNWLD